VAALLFFAAIFARGAETELVIFPAEISIAAGASHRLVVTRREAGGRETDVTGEAEFVAEKPAVAAGAGLIRVRAAGLSAAAKVNVSSAPANRELKFVNDVLPVLGRAGCNSGACHAKPEGQAGFKLSVFAYDPKSDYDAILKNSRGRRVVAGAPDASLLLRKPTMDVNHGGGLRLRPESDGYRLLVEWIRQGMPYGRTNDAALTGIEVFPHERTYAKEATQRLLVRARYSDGRAADVTHLAEFMSNDKEVAKIDEDGVVKIGTASGQGVVVARFMGMVDVSRITVPSGRVLPEGVYAGLKANNEIDTLVYAQLRRLGLAPSGPCSDAEFIRRSALDVTGQLPTAEEARAFLADRDPARREKWIDRLLDHPAYADHWANKWADLLRPNPSRVGVKSVYVFDNWLRECFRQNLPYDRMIGELLVAQGSTHKYGPAVFFRDRREPADVASIVSQIFLGIRMECAKCHHHPSEKWSQTDFYRLAAYFAQIKRKGQGISAPISGEPEYIWSGGEGAVSHPVTGEKLSPAPPDGPEAQIESGADPRAAFAQWLHRADNPHFARAAANRVWAELMGRGIVEPVDDFRASNPPSNEALIDFLAKDFISHGFDLKQLMRTILRSRVYQASSLPNEFNVSDTKNFSHALRRRLPAEPLSDAVFAVTQTADSFQGLPAGARAGETWNHKLDSDFLDAFGRPNSSAECPCERDARPSVVQVLHLMNSGKLQSRIGSTDGRAARLASGKLAPPEIVAELYLAAYSRLPTSQESRLAEAAFSAEGASRKTATEDVMWALINSAEFIFNH
jgi:hypothetical protein